MKTEEKILRSALELFATRGIDKTSTAQISSDAGIAAGTLFVHFKTKQDLVDTLYLRIKRSAFAGMHGSMDPNSTVEDDVKAISASLISYYLSNYHELVFLELVEDDPQVSLEAIAAGSEAYRSISELVQEHLDKGILKRIGLELLQNLIWGMVKSIVKQCRKSGTKEIDPVYLDVIWDAIKG